MGNCKYWNPDGTRMLCEILECSEPIRVKGMCSYHYGKDYRIKTRTTDTMYFDICPTNNCGRRKLASAAVCKRCGQLAWRYSLEKHSVPVLFAEENYVCQNPGCDSTEGLCMDHDHACCPTGKFPQSKKVSCGVCVRGWLCRTCNTALGLLKEDPRRIEGLLEYLGVKPGND